ncbi:MAG: type II secretion system protein M [Pseudomonadales bacterium]|jgi:general secretion pathway protein M
MLDNLQQQFAISSLGRWYFGREPQERIVIASLAAFIAILLLWASVWKPISDWREIEDNRYRNAQSLLDWVQANEARARAVAKTQQNDGGANRSLLPTITSSAAAEGLTLNRLQPETSGAVSVVLQAQRFNALVRWIDQLQVNNGVTLQRVSVDGEGRPGYINAQLRLQ